MAQSTVNSEENCIRFHYLYAVEFGKKRIMRPESMKFVLGRSECSDFVISSPKVSTKHCEIVCSGENWILKNLSPEGTSLVGRTVARNDSVILGSEAILKIGGIYIQCKTEVESAQPPQRILKISVLIGEKCCYLAAETENLPVEPILIDDAPESMDNATTEMPTENNKPTKMDEEINSIVNSIASENQHLIEELKVTKGALRKALTDKEELEYLASVMQEQLRIYEEEASNNAVIEEMMENELQCSICNELMVDAITLSCSHTYCGHCLLQWKRSNSICPICRRNIQHECKTRVIDSLIERMTLTLPSDTQERRKELVQQRKAHNQ